MLQLARRQNISMEQLCEGLLSSSNFYNIFNDNRVIGYSLRHRLMNRLGLDEDFFEEYVFTYEYDLHEKCLEIIDNIERDNTNDAIRSLHDINDQYEDIDVCTRQFLMDIEARIKPQNKALEQLRATYHQIIKMTVTDDSLNNIQNSCLSITEYYYLTWYYYYSALLSNKENAMQLIHIFETLVECIINKNMVGSNMAKVLPMAVCKFSESLYDYMDRYAKNNLWKYSTRAVNCLYEAQRTYYYQELVKIRKKISKELGIINEYSEFESRINTYLDILNEKYRIVPIDKSGYIYKSGNVYSISSVIRSRRLLLGLSKKDLVNGICSVRTLERIEHTSIKSQKFNLENLFERLYLYGGYVKPEILTKDIVSLEVLQKCKSSINQYAQERAEEYFSRLLLMIDNDDIANQQTITRIKSALNYRQKIISKSKYCSELLRAISMTIGDRMNYINPDTYITASEIITIYNYAMQTHNIDLAKLLMDNCKAHSKVFTENTFRLYTLVGKWYASELGNMHKFEESEKCYDELIYESLKMYNAWPLPECLYNRIWNDREKRNVQETEAYNLEEMQKCIDFAEYDKNVFSENFYKNKLRKNLKREKVNK